MRYLVLVSHGTFAPGLHSVLDMLCGKRDDILSTSLEDGMSADVYVEHLKEKIQVIGPDDSVFLFGDIIGGSPLTNTHNTTTEKGLLPHTVAFGGVNLPMAISALMAIEDGLDNDALRAQLLSESKEAIKEVELQVAEEGEDDL